MIWINTFFSAAKNTKKEKIFNQNCSFPLKGLSEIYYLTRLKINPLRLISQ